MAIRGLSQGERERFIFSADPSHPDNIRSEARKRAGDNLDTENVDRIAEEVKKEVGEPTIFFVRPLTRQDKTELGDMGGASMRDGAITLINVRTRKAYVTCQRGLAGWENFLDPNGKDIPYQTTTVQTSDGGFREVVTDECLSRLSQDELAELAEFIMEQNGMTSELEKKLQGALLRSEGLTSPLSTAPTAPKTNE